MTVLPVDQIPSELPMLISALGPGDEIVLMDGDKPVARVTPVGAETARPKRRLGTAKGVLRIIAEDDEHLDAFGEYM